MDAGLPHASTRACPEKPNVPGQAAALQLLRGLSGKPEAPTPAWRNQVRCYPWATRLICGFFALFSIDAVRMR
jgi:hypothetical protein